MKTPREYAEQIRQAIKRPGDRSTVEIVAEVIAEAMEEAAAEARREQEKRE